LTAIAPLLSGLVSRLLAAHAAEQGIDLFPAAAKCRRRAGFGALN